MDSLVTKGKCDRKRPVSKRQNWASLPNETLGWTAWSQKGNVTEGKGRG